MTTSRSTRALLAWALGELGAVQQGLEIARVAVERGNHVPPFRPWALAALARLELWKGDPNAAEVHLREADSTLLLQGSALSPVFVMLTKAELALVRQDYAAAIVIADRLLEYLRQTETRVLASDALFLKARGLLGSRQVDAADKVLRQAESEATAVGSRRSHWNILLALSRLEAERGRLQDAATLRARARDMVQELVDSLRQPELRLAFEQLPATVAVLTPGGA